MKTISLIMPFRERIELLEQMLRSLKDTAYKVNNLELIMAVDDDDEIWKKFGKDILRSHSWLDIKVYETQRSEEIVKAYWNPIAKMARGRWVMDINDDSVFKTPEWDGIINLEMERRARFIGDDVIYGKVDDCYKEGGRDNKNCYFSTWAIQGKEAVDALGFFYDPCIHVGGGDHVMALIFVALSDIMHENRIVEMYDVVIDHFSYYTGQREKDDLARRQENIHHRNYFVTTREHEMEYAVRLKEYIDNKRSGK